MSTLRKMINYSSVAYDLCLRKATTEEVAFMRNPGGEKRISLRKNNGCGNEWIFEGAVLIFGTAISCMLLEFNTTVEACGIKDERHA